MKVFNFNPADFSKEYEEKGYVHIKGGVDSDFLKLVQDFTKDAIAHEEKASLEKWRFVGKKMQFLFEFPESINFDEDVKSIVGTVAGIPKGDVTICERHIKVYDDTAAPNPPAHKDRLASEITVGLPLQVPDNSYLILYPDNYLDINPYSSTALYRTSLDADQLPEVVLEDIEPTKVFVWPGDVVLFKGSMIYHERVNPANTQLLYLKFNSMFLDPIGEDPKTIQLGELSKSKINEIDDPALLDSVVIVSPKVDKLSKHYSRLNWQELYQIYIWDEKEITASKFEFDFIRAIDGKLTVKEILQKIGQPSDDNTTSKIKRLILLGVLYIT